MKRLQLNIQNQTKAKNKRHRQAQVATERQRQSTAKQRPRHIYGGKEVKTPRPEGTVTTKAEALKETTRRQWTETVTQTKTQNVGMN